MSENFQRQNQNHATNQAQNLNGIQPNSIINYPVHELSINDILLSKNYLDDYQRLYFVSCFIKFFKNGTRNLSITNDLNIKKTIYKSNVAQIFNNSNDNNQTVTFKLLNCFEYQFPDLQKNQLNDNDLNSLTYLTKDIKEKLSIPHTIYSKKNLQLFINSNIPNLHNNGNPSTTDLTTNEENEKGSQEIAINDSNLNSLSKNHQFKLNNNNETLINPNNYIIWTYDTGYVFLTGIWRLYQDVMKGLIYLKRYTDENENMNNNKNNKNKIPINKELEKDYINETCIDEFEFVMNHVFYDDLTNLDFDTIHAKKRRRSATKFNNLVNPINLNESHSNPISNPNSPTSHSPYPTSGTNYTDLHWNNISNELKDFLLITFKDYLRIKRNLPESQLTNLTIYDLIQRIRGGYIKIQGTWLPWEISRILCIRFCYPIRFLLVPLFGPDFPKDCEFWHKNIQQKLLYNNGNIATVTTTTTTNINDSVTILNNEKITNNYKKIQKPNEKEIPVTQVAKPFKKRKKRVSKSKKISEPLKKRNAKVMNIRNHLTKAFKVLLKTAQMKRPLKMPLTDLNFARYKSYHYQGNLNFFLVTIPTLRKNIHSNNLKLPSLNYTLSDNSDNKSINTDIIIEGQLKMQRHIQGQQRQQMLENKAKQQELATFMRKKSSTMPSATISPRTSVSHVPLYIGHHPVNRQSQDSIEPKMSTAINSQYYRTNGHRYSYPMNVRYSSTGSISNDERFSLSSNNNINQDTDNRSSMNANYLYNNGQGLERPRLQFVSQVPRSNNWANYPIPLTQHVGYSHQNGSQPLFENNHMMNNNNIHYDNNGRIIMMNRNSVNQNNHNPSIPFNVEQQDVSSGSVRSGLSGSNFVPRFNAEQTQQNVLAWRNWLNGTR
ncbi:hypothetical protein Kpol_1003p28 [Vanderwaltozyma polyspora DSM 70294]|uniref:HTH APSES-type domain-containing protein n=1 Tax=Vanderwaltozyma polyspora (strain ATCC 22028 / DSM 70294 / BCRC 21397 / CBS 2163 / NBRC 10782 / NRRL Y-8283 / UCD 57-17) TaxID=436907 RepID=A7TLY6_VANPO|nr:uncharacterized protein Kpol_1003p28 [Vanderwaltozyma polyspora DSM 70294]EDO16723.1 hypothetical protein Kpol_1003p28 [Vanderwaltozyma polyspora DSM 70294]